MMIEDLHLDLRIQPTSFEWTNAIGIMGIDQNQLRHLCKIEIFELGEVQVVCQEKGMHRFLRPAGQHQSYIGVQLAHSDHRSQPVEVRVVVGRYDIHNAILAGSMTSRNARIYLSTRLIQRQVDWRDGVMPNVVSAHAAVRPEDRRANRQRDRQDDRRTDRGDRGRYGLSSQTNGVRVSTLTPFCYLLKP